MSSSERTDRATALITGASSGIGYQYARQLAARGYDLLIVSNDAEGIANSAAEIRKQYGVRVSPLYRDLSAENAAEDLYRYCEDERLDVEVLVNNAGVFFFDDLARVDSRRIELMLRLHVRTTTLLCHYFGRSMQARGRGYILNMSSMSAWDAVSRHFGLRSDEKLPEDAVAGDPQRAVRSRSPRYGGLSRSRGHRVVQSQRALSATGVGGSAS